MFKAFRKSLDSSLSDTISDSVSKSIKNGLSSSIQGSLEKTIGDSIKETLTKNLKDVFSGSKLSDSLMPNFTKNIDSISSSISKDIVTKMSKNNPELLKTIYRMDSPGFISNINKNITDLLPTSLDNTLKNSNNKIMNDLVDFMKTDEGKSIFKKYLADMPDTNNSINKTMDNVIDDLDINLRANAGKIDTPDKSINKIQSFTEKFKNTTIKVTILGVTGLLGLALGEYLYDKFIEKDAFRGNVTRIVKEEGKTNSLIIYYTPDVNWCNGSKVIVKEFRGVTPSIDGQVFNPDVIGPGILRLSPTILPIQNVNKDADGIIAYGYETYSEIDCLIERPSSPGDGDGGDGGGEADGDGDGDGENTNIIKPTSTKKLSTYIYIGIFIIVIIVIIFFLKKNIFKYK